MSTLEVFFMEPKFRNQCFTYSFELKMQAIQLYYSGYSRTEIAEMLKVKNKRLINEWVNKYERLGEEGLRDKRGAKKGMGKGRPRKTSLTLEEENQLLKAENLYLKKLLEQKRGC
ncbi:transposase [Bacillus methanolicus]|nr:transposase [Bacillus methanolicus]MDE3839823.1 transposase [Bacillus methanolicus]MDE3839935.1 transposase [Bacillus methanolicus]